MLTRRNLLFGLLFVALVFGAMHIFRGTSNKNAASSTKQTAACVLHKTSKHHKHAAAHHSGKLHKQTMSCTTRKTKAPVVALRVKRPVHHPLRSYARHLVAVLDRSRAVFDQAAAASVAGGLDQIGSACTSYGTRINILEARADGVSHPGPWYGPVAVLHHTILGIYHDMEGSLQSCSVDASNGDPSSVGLAQSDIANADHALRNMDDNVHALARSK